MCSGCAGDYEGAFEDSAEPALDPGERNYAAGIPDGPPLRGGAGGSFEITPDSEGNPALASFVGLTSESAGEICEIVVSATRIVELRVVTVNLARIEMDELAGSRVAAMPVAHEQSRTALAKYYQTRGNDPEGGNHRAQVRRFRRPAADAPGGLKGLLQRVRRALGNLTSKISE